MPIEISVIYSPENVEVLKPSHTFPDEGGTLGRSNNNFWILQDPNKYMSSVHAKIECISDVYYLTDMSTNGTFINGASEPVGNSNKVELNDGDHFTISDYEFVANIPQNLSIDPFAAPINDDPFSDFDFPKAEPQINDDLDFLSPATPSDPFASGINQFAVTENHHSTETTDPMAILDRKPNNLDNSLGGTDLFSAEPTASVFPESATFNNDNSYESQPVVTDSIDWPVAKPEVSAIPDDWDDWDTDPSASNKDFPGTTPLNTRILEPSHGVQNIPSTPQSDLSETGHVTPTFGQTIPDDPFDDLLGNDISSITSDVPKAADYFTADDQVHDYHTASPQIPETPQSTAFGEYAANESPFGDSLAMGGNENTFGQDPFSNNASISPTLPSSKPIQQIDASPFVGDSDIVENVSENINQDNVASDLAFDIPNAQPLPTSLSSSAQLSHSDAELDVVKAQNKQLQKKVSELTAQLQASQDQVTALKARPVASPSTQVNTSENEIFNSVVDAMGLAKWNLQPNKVAEINHIVGVLMRETMEGMMRVLKFRKKIKEEFRINVTTIQSVENNPLKFSANIDDAMENMFIKENNAYKSPVDAVREGFESIAEHQVAVVAGMQAAFKGMIERFDPLHLESRFEKYNNSSFLSLGQKTKRWNDYKAYHKELTENLDDSFQHLFGYDFVQAYEEQMQHLISERIKENQNTSQQDS